MNIPTAGACGWLQSLLVVDREWLLADGFPNATAPDALNAHTDDLDRAVGQRSLYVLQVGLKFSPRATGDFRTDTTQVLGFTSSLNSVADLGAFSAYFAVFSHNSEPFFYFSTATRGSAGVWNGG
jgi:hypothetical protein